MSAAARGAGMLLLALAASGCGDPDLWARWQAERALWLAERARSGAGIGSEATRALEPRFARIVEQFPASRWAPRALHPGVARDVAVVASQAQLRLAGMALDRNELALAAERAARLAADWEAVPPLAAPGLEQLASARIRLGDEAGAQRALEGIVRTAPLLAEDGRSLDRVAAKAPFTLARIARARGDEPAAQWALLRIEARAVEALPRADEGTRLAIEHFRSQVRIARGDLMGAFAKEHELAARSQPGEQAAALLDLAEAALDLGLPDRAMEFAREAETSLSRRVGGVAMLVSARCQLAIAQPDSALSTLERLSERWYDLGALTPEVRFLRGEALEMLQREESARSERKALIAGYPTHPLAFLALVRVVAHHVDAGQGDLARLEGAQALATLQRTLTQHRDPDVLREVIRARTDILERLGRTAEADSSAFELFGRFPDDSIAQALVLTAVSRWPPSRGSQAALWRARIASRSMSPEVRARARRESRGEDAR